MSLRTRYLFWLILLAIVDVFIPVPLAVIFLIYVIYTRPPWFLDLVTRIYRQEA